MVVRMAIRVTHRAFRAAATSSRYDAFMYRAAAAALIAMTMVSCAPRDELEHQRSRDGRYTLTPSFYEGTLVRLTVKETKTGRVIDVASSRDTDAMKWVTGWVDNTSYLFWGSDTGTAWVRQIGGSSVTEAPLAGAACARFEELYRAKYGTRNKDHVGACSGP